MRSIVSLLLLAACTQEATPVAADAHDTSAPEPTDSFGLALTEDADVSVMLHATWTDPGSTETWVEYRFDDTDWQRAPALGTGEAVLLGIPQQTTVEARVGAIVDGDTVYSASATGRTGDLPHGMIQPDLVTLEDDLVSDTPYFMVSVAQGAEWYEGPYEVEIFDRRGNIVWYRQTTSARGPVTLSATVSNDGTHIWYENADVFGFVGGGGDVTRSTLDGRWQSTFEAPALGQAISEGPDGSFFMEHRASDAHGVDQMDATGALHTVWDCDATFTDLGLSPDECLLNAVNWSPATGTLLASQFETSTIFELDAATGAVVRQMGQLTEGTPYTFDPPEANFAYQHYPHWTPEGTLLLTTHQPCDGTETGRCDSVTGRSHYQLAAEYTVDDTTHTLTRVWSYASTSPWATQAGEVTRLDNRSLLQGFGQDGSLEEVTAEGEVAWRVDWEPSPSGYRLIGHASAINDLYALNRGQ